MRPITTLARPLVAAPYIMTGLETLRDPRPRAEQVAPTVKPIADRLEWLPTKDPETLVRAQGALSLGTGVLLLTGRFRRLTTLLMAAQLLPTLATEHHYWTEDDPERRGSERSHLLKNAGLFGALLMVATEPRRSPKVAELRRQAREARLQAGAETKVLRRETAAEIRNARREMARQVREARAEARRRSRGRGGPRAASAASAQASKAAAKGSKLAAKGSKAAAKGSRAAGAKTATFGRAAGARAASARKAGAKRIKAARR
ncbi:DoxX family membrane protein [Spirillospora sp. NPDC029432]|uniref:DoxX family protein n=1 Tax=Spirillospora sp. NPDC029432 TaxID=3154599 RepID=UPI00345136AD